MSADLPPDTRMTEDAPPWDADAPDAPEERDDKTFNMFADDPDPP